MGNIQLTLSTLTGNFNKFILTKLQKPSLQEGSQLKKFFLLDIYLALQIQVPTQYYDDIVNVNKNFALFKSYPTTFNSREIFMGVFLLTGIKCGTDIGYARNKSHGFPNYWSQILLAYTCMYM